MNATRELFVFFLAMLFGNHRIHPIAQKLAAYQAPPENVRYGDRVVIRHKASGLYLNAGPDGSSVICSPEKSINSYWLIKGPHKTNAPLNCDIGAAVRCNQPFRFEYPSSNKNLTGLAVVTLSGIGGVGSNADDWKIQLNQPSDTNKEVAVTNEIRVLNNLNPTQKLTAAATKDAKGMLQVTCATDASDNSIWIIDSFDTYTVMPAGFEREYGLTAGIACGSRTVQGNSALLEVWCLTEDRQKLRHYNPTLMTENPWEEITPVSDNGSALGLIDDLAIGSDGTLIIVLNTGTAHLYNWTSKKFSPLPSGDPNLVLDEISVGNRSDIFAVNQTSKNLYKHNGKDWTLIDQGNTKHVAAGLDGTVVILDNNGIPFFYNGDRQFELMGTPQAGVIASTRAMPGSIATGSIKLENIASGNISNIVGSTDSGEITRWDNTRKRWISFLDTNGNPAAGIKEISINAAGCIFLTSRSGDIWNNSETCYIIKKIAVASEVEKKENKNIKIVSGSIKEPIKAQSRLQAKKEGRVKILSHAEQAAQLAAAPPKRQRRTRVIRRFQAAVPAPPKAAQANKTAVTPQRKKSP